MNRVALSLRVKIFAGCLIVAVCIMTLSIVLMYHSALVAIERNATAYITTSTSYANQNLDRMVADAEKITLAMAINKDLLTNAIFSEVDEASYEWLNIKKQTTDLLSGMVAYKDYIVMAAVVRTDGRCIQTTGNMLFKSIALDDWFVETAQENSIRIFYNVPSPKRIFVCRPIRYSGETMALAIIELNFEILNDVYNITPLAQAEVVTFTEDGSIVFSNNKQYTQGYIYESPLAESIGNYTPTEKYYYINGQKHLMVKYYSSANHLTTVGTVSYNNLITDALHIRSQMLLIILFSVALALIMALLVSRIIYRSIADIKRSMHNVQMGNLQSRIFVQGNDEIAEMANVFNRMMDEILLLMESLRRKEKQKREAEQNALLSQIQPHFICNAINSIKYMAHQRGQTQIEQMATALVELLRGILDNLNEFVPLRQEASYIEDYVCIQQFKYGRTYKLTWEVGDRLWQALVPKLFLQPIVENALLHGIADMENGCVQIKIFEHQDILHCSVTDNGKGMTDEIIEQVITNKRSHHSQFRNIGFANVIERIQLIYGRQYGGKILSTPGEFTTVELTIPLQTEEVTP